MRDNTNTIMACGLGVAASLALVAWNLAMGGIIQHYIGDNYSLVLWATILLSVVIGPAISSMMQEGHPFESLTTTYVTTLCTEAALVTVAALGTMMVKETAKATADTAKGISITISPEVLWYVGPVLIGFAIGGVLIYLCKNDL